jgi:hypothetical protein
VGIFRKYKISKDPDPVSRGDKENFKLQNRPTFIPGSVDDREDFNVKHLIGIRVAYHKSKSQYWTCQNGDVLVTK